MTNIDVPVDMETRYLHGINVRLEAIIHQLSSIVDVLANQTNTAVEVTEVKQEVKTRKKVM